MSFRSEKLYQADTEALQIIDFFHEARQRSLTQHETMRVEINQTRNIIRLISEGEPGNAVDDKEIKSLKLRDPNEVVVGIAPKNISEVPTEISPIPLLTFKKSVHPLSNSDMVATLRFVHTGKVLNAGSNAIGTNATMSGATIYVWMPDKPTSTTGSIIRAITIQGTSGLTKYLKCAMIDAKCKNWVR